MISTIFSEEKTYSPRKKNHILWKRKSRENDLSEKPPVREFEWTIFQKPLKNKCISQISSCLIQRWYVGNKIINHMLRFDWTCFQLSAVPKKGNLRHVAAQLKIKDARWSMISWKWGIRIIAQISICNNWNNLDSSSIFASLSAQQLHKLQEMAEICINSSRNCPKLFRSKLNNRKYLLMDIFFGLVGLFQSSIFDFCLCVSGKIFAENDEGMNTESSLVHRQFQWVDKFGQFVRTSCN